MTARARASEPAIESLRVSAYRIPTDAPESDGTLEWDATTLVLVEASAGGKTGLGYTYADRAAASVVEDDLSPVVVGRSAFRIGEVWEAMVRASRNLGRGGIVSMAVSAVDNSLWDLKGKLLGLALVDLLGAVRESVPVYGSGGFTSYDVARLEHQLGGWVSDGIPRVKMKVGREPRRDVERVRAARRAIGPDAELFVDANGAYTPSRAVDFAERFAELGVVWLEEPVVSDDLDGLRWIRRRAPGRIEIAAGEYGYDLTDFRRMLEAEAVDVLQADATRCGGITGFLRASALCRSRFVPLSAHTAPALHVHVGCAAEPIRHIEYFHDHVRIEDMVFDGVRRPEKGELRPDRSRPGLGLEFKAADAERYAA